MNDIKGIEDIRLLVDEFYNQVRRDELLAPIFAERIQGDWQPHLETMYRFWNAALFGVKEYVGNPYMKHALLPVDANHFQRWITLFYETIEKSFSGINADEAKRKAMMMAQVFYGRISKRDERPLGKFPEIGKMNS